MGKKGKGQHDGKMYYGCKAPPWNCQKFKKEKRKGGEI